MLKRMVLAGAMMAGVVTQTQAAEPVKLGFMAGLSGVFAIVGTEMQRGLDLALAELGGKLGGVPVTVYAVDDKTSPPEGVQLASKLMDQDKIDLLTGMMASNVVIAVEKSFTDAGVIVVSALAGPQQFAGKECNPNAFFTSFENEDWDAALGRYMTDKGIKSAYFMGADYQAGWEKLAGAIRAYKGKAIGPFFTPLNQLDFSAELAQIRAAKPEAVFVFYPGALGIAFLKQYAQAGLQGEIPVYSEDTMASELSFPAEGDAALGVIQSSSWSAELDNPANRKFVAGFVAKYGRKPSVFAALQYDAVKLIDSAVAAVHGNVADKDGLRAALRRADFQSVRGPFRFNNNQFPIQNTYITKVVKGADGALRLALTGTAVTDGQDNYHQECPMKW
jgi:branched-chain amino acid transport system substrate-binding protein